MALSPNTVVARADGQVSSELGDEIVIFHVDAGTYFGLEGVGARVWELLANPTTLKEIQRTVLKEYEVEPERCRRDLVRLVTDLVDRGLVEVRD